LYRPAFLHPIGKTVFKTNTQLGNAVINDIRELVDQTKNSRSDCARTTLSVIAASTSGLNVQKEQVLASPAFLHPIGKTVFKIINGGCLRVCFNFVSILSFSFGFFQAFFSFVFL
jgi:hypothetical protein